jgi:hypothetical protein
MNTQIFAKTSDLLPILAEIKTIESTRQGVEPYAHRIPPSGKFCSHRAMNEAKAHLKSLKSNQPITTNMKSPFAKKTDLEAIEQQINDPNYQRPVGRSKAVVKDSPYVPSYFFDHALKCFIEQGTQATAAPSKPITAPIMQKSVTPKPQAPVGRTAEQFLAMSVVDQNQLIRACCAQNAGAATRKEIRAAYESADSKTRLAFYRVFKISLTSFN